MLLVGTYQTFQPILYTLNATNAVLCCMQEIHLGTINSQHIINLANLLHHEPELLAAPLLEKQRFSLLQPKCRTPPRFLAR